MKKKSSYWFLPFGFSSLIGLMVLVIYISLSEMDTAINEMETLVKVTNAKISTAHAMRDHVRQRALDLDQFKIINDTPAFFH